MAIKADWGAQAVVDELPTELQESEKFDPFDAARSAWTMINALDKTQPVADITLETPVSVLRAMLSVSVKREARFDAAGITCALKDCGEVSCLACPFNKAADDDDPKQTLCKIGMEQDILATYLLAKAHGDKCGAEGGV